MKLSDFKYIMVIEGGGWGYTLDTYGITPDGKVYETEKMPNEAIRMLAHSCELNAEFIGQMSQDIEFKKTCSNNFPVIFDAPELSLYEVRKRSIQRLYRYYPNDERNPQLINEIERIIREFRKKQSLKKQNESFKNNIIIGEVNEGVKTRQLINAILTQPTDICTQHGVKSEGLIETLNGLARAIESRDNINKTKYNDRLIELFNYGKEK